MNDRASLKSSCPRRVRRRPGTAAAVCRPEPLERRAMLSAATNPMDLVFSAPADVADRGVHVGIFGKLVTTYTPSSGPNAGSPIAAGTIVYLQGSPGG